MKHDPKDIDVISTVRVCKDKRFLVGEEGNSNGVYIGLGTDGSEKAVKIFDKVTHRNVCENEKDLLMNEEIKTSNHVVKYWNFDKTSNRDFAYLIMDLYEGTLEDFIVPNESPDPVNFAPKIIEQILTGLKDLHKANILHRDLKPWNILRNIDDQWFLADFGIGRILPDDKTTHLSIERGTKKWQAVESISRYKSGTPETNQVNYKRTSDIQVRLCNFR